jgi:hypothetical protein
MGVKVLSRTLSNPGMGRYRTSTPVTDLGSNSEKSSSSPSGVLVDSGSFFGGFAASFTSMSFLRFFSNTSFCSQSYKKMRLLLMLREKKLEWFE